jgi:hypothetical protein
MVRFVSMSSWTAEDVVASILAGNRLDQQQAPATCPIGLASPPASTD